jgi:hypothetical protein
MGAIWPNIRYWGKYRAVCCLIVFASYAGMFGGCLRPVSDVGVSETLLLVKGDKASDFEAGPGSEGLFAAPTLKTKSVPHIA